MTSLDSHHLPQAPPPHTPLPWGSGLQWVERDGDRDVPSAAAIQDAPAKSPTGEVPSTTPFLLQARGQQSGLSLPASLPSLTPQETGPGCPEEEVSGPRGPVSQRQGRPWLEMRLCPCRSPVASSSNWILMKRMGVREQFTTLACAEALQLNRLCLESQAV